jgi:hypothetical protein
MSLEMLSQPFVKTQITDDNSFFRSHIISDFDKDGDKDLIMDVYRYGVDEVRLYLNDNKQFTESTILTGHSIKIIDTSDVDKDGDIDFLVDYNNSSYSDSYISLVENDIGSSGTVTSHRISENWKDKIYFGDVDNDGDDDLIYGDGFDLVFAENRLNGWPQYSYYSGFSSNHNFGNHYYLWKSIGTNFSYISVADFTNDGVNDVAVGFNGWFGSNTNYYPKLVLLDFNTNQATEIDDEFVVCSVADYNMDGKIDLLKYTSLGLYYYKNQGGGNFTSTLGHIEPYLSWLEIGDFNNDGDIDLLYVNSSTGMLTLKQNDGNNSFTTINIDSSSTDWESPKFSDIDFDGDLDIVVFAESDGVYLFENLEPNVIPEYTDFDIQVFPNPSNGEISIVFDGSADGNTYKVNIYDIFGRSVFDKEMAIANTKIDISELAMGTYIIEIRIAQKIFRHKIFMNNH